MTTAGSNLHDPYVPYPITNNKCVVSAKQKPTPCTTRTSNTFNSCELAPKPCVLTNTQQYDMSLHFEINK